MSLEAGIPTNGDFEKESHMFPDLEFLNEASAPPLFSRQFGTRDLARLAIAFDSVIE